MIKPLPEDSIGKYICEVIVVAGEALPINLDSYRCGKPAEYEDGVSGCPMCREHAELWKRAEADKDKGDTNAITR